MTWQAVEGILQKGHRVASGLATDSPYEAGTIKLQTPHFKRLGLDLTPYFAGTLNLSIAPKTFTILQPSHTFPNLKWHPNFDPETFSFCPCRIIAGDRPYDGLIYYPHPETKINHFQNPHIVELIAPPISDIEYGDRLILQVRPHEVAIE